ncbi:hypothetical protein F4809DRAFT_645849 [Biscogniauxia mediterranea]|nr:hypothetical protein F4809DRAFT_645849 [Biscogniauxia mediterranea]
MDSLYFDTFGAEHPCDPDETPESIQSWCDGWEVPCSRCRTRGEELCRRCRIVSRKMDGKSALSPKPISWETAHRHNGSNDTRRRGLRYLGFRRIVLPLPPTFGQCPDPDSSGESSTPASENGYEEQYPTLSASIVCRNWNWLGDLWEEEDLDQSECSGEEDSWSMDAETEEPDLQTMSGYLCYGFKQQGVSQRRPRFLYCGIGLGGVSTLSYGMGSGLRQPLPQIEGPGSRIWSMISAAAIWGYKQGARILGYDIDFQKALSQLD